MNRPPSARKRINRGSRESVSPIHGFWRGGGACTKATILCKSKFYLADHIVYGLKLLFLFMPGNAVTLKWFLFHTIVVTLFFFYLPSLSLEYLNKLLINSKHVRECAQCVIAEQRILSYEYI